MIAIPLALALDASAPQPSSEKMLSIAVGVYETCIKDTARKWASGSATADVIAQGVIPKCELAETVVRDCFYKRNVEHGYSYAGAANQDLWQERFLPSLRSRANSLAIATVLDARTARSKK